MRLNGKTQRKCRERLAAILAALQEESPRTTPDLIAAAKLKYLHSEDIILFNEVLRETDSPHKLRVREQPRAKGKTGGNPFLWSIEERKPRA